MVLGELHMKTSRRTVLRHAVGITAAGIAMPYVARAQEKRELKIAHTSSIQEMAIYAFPEFIDPKYSINFLNFGGGTTMIAAMMKRMFDAMSTANSYLITAKSEGAPIVAVSGCGGKGHAIMALSLIHI